MLSDIQDASLDAGKLPRPRPPQFKESAGVHAPVPGLTKKAWAELLEIFKQRCRYCGAAGPLEQDHRIPMSRIGQNRISNIVPACRSCNQAKGKATEKDYLRALRELWGRRVPRKPRRMDERLAEIERRYAKEATEDRTTTMLRSLKIPSAA